MKYQALRLGNTQPYRVCFPVSGSSTWKIDYPVGFIRSHAMSNAASRYFLFNRGWRRSRNLFSHVRTSWEAGLWWAQVWYVDRRRSRYQQLRRLVRWFQRAYFYHRRVMRRRRYGQNKTLLHRLLRRLTSSGTSKMVTKKKAVEVTNRWSRPAAVVSVRSASLLHEMAIVWARPETQWCWCRLPALFRGNVDTVMAHLAYRLRGRHERRLKGVALPLLRLTQKMPAIVGAQVRCHGRFGRRQRADHEFYRWGQLGRTNLGHTVKEGFLTRSFRFGAVGVSLLLSYAS